MIQAVTFSSPNVGGHQQPLSSGHVFTHHPKKVTKNAELPGNHTLPNLESRRACFNKKNGGSNTQKKSLKKWPYHYIQKGSKN